MTYKSPNPIASRRIWVVLLGSLLLAGLLPGTALAAASVTSATGGGAISADTAATAPGSNTFATTLTGPGIAGAGAGDIGAGTLTFTISGAFEFQAGQGSAGLSGGAGCGTLALGVQSVSSGAATVATTGSSAGACSITFSGLKVHPTNGTPLDTTGSITASGLASGAAGSLVEVPGSAVLSYQTAPSTSATAGSALGTQPVVLSQDQFGNVRSGDSILLTSVPPTGGLSCTTNPKLTNGSGLASFSAEACKFSSQGSYVMRASVSGGTSADSATITVAPAPATKLVFTTQPGLSTPGTNLSPQPVVAIQDNFGNTVASASATILLTKLAPDAGGPGTLVGCSTAPTVNGVATFSGCRIDAVGVGYRLTASDNTGGGAPHPYTPVTSTKFDVRDQLVFTTPPSTTTSAGVTFATQPVVAVRAGALNTAVNDSTTSVALSLSGGPVGATLTCTSNPLTVTAGVASFAACRIDRIGTYTLIASATGLGTVTSTGVTITAGAASKLGFTAQPAVGVTAQAFPIQPVVAVQDAGGNTVASGTNSNATVTLTLGTAPAGAVLTCSGGNVRVAVAGLATFSGCSVNTAGTYTLVASATSLTSVTSTAFVVTVPGASITLTNSASVITWGSGVGLTVQFGANGGNKAFALQVARDGVSWSTIANLTTNASGQATLSYRPATNLYYRAVFAGTLDLTAGNSNTTRTVVRQIALLRPHSTSTTSITRNTSITFSTTVRPSRPELPATKVSFVFYRRVGSHWTLVTTRNVVINSLGKASTTFKFSTAGSWYVRSIANPTPFNANSVWSPLERYSVR